jgi:hypothetical protein
MADSDKALEDAEEAVWALMERHHAAAIPAMLAACVSWAVRHGAPDLIETSLRNAADMVPEAAAAWRKAVD